jgi:hypothetical protein
MAFLARRPTLLGGLSFIEKFGEPDEGQFVIDQFREITFHLRSSDRVWDAMVDHNSELVIRKIEHSESFSEILTVSALYKLTERRSRCLYADMMAVVNDLQLTESTLGRKSSKSVPPSRDWCETLARHDVDLSTASLRSVLKSCSIFREEEASRGVEKL